MAVTPVTIQELHTHVLNFSLEPKRSLSQFSYPEWFEDRCKKYLRASPPDGGSLSIQRFPTLNFDGLVLYNYHKEPQHEEFENCTEYATVKDVKNWKTAIKCLQRYCLNLLLAPKRQDFHQIKVSSKQHYKAVDIMYGTKCSQMHFSNPIGCCGLMQTYCVVIILFIISKLPYEICRISCQIL